MYRTLWHFTLGLIVLVGCVAFTSAQEDKKKADDAEDKKPAEKIDRKLAKAAQEYKETVLNKLEEEYRLKFRKPETPAEFWTAIKFEVELGKFDLAAEFLKGFLEATKDKGQELLVLVEAEGFSSFLKLRNVANWAGDPNVDKKLQAQINKEARANVEELINRVAKALKDHLQDKTRITKYVTNLSATPEERAYALVQLRRSGPIAVPYFVAALRTAEDAEEREAIRSAIGQFTPEMLPPLLAAIDIDDKNLRLDVIDAFRKRADSSIVPYLWFLSASPKESQEVREKAIQALVYFQGVSPDKLPPAAVALTHEADRYYRHQVKFPDPQAVTVWQVEGKEVKLPAAVMPATQAEEYYGLKFARQALELDPSYVPAQRLFLSLAMEKAYERTGLDKPLEKGLKDVLKTINPELVMDVMDRALAEHRLGVILGAIETLGDLVEVRAARPTTRGDPVLVKALNYPDRRVQFAAADALLRIPGSKPTGRIVEVLRRAANADGVTRVLVADANTPRTEQTVRNLRQAGFDAVVVGTGREALRRLAEAADIDLAIVDHALPDPGLAYFLAQLRSDVHVGLLPVLVVAAPEREKSLSALAGRYRNIWVTPPLTKPDVLKQTVLARIADASGQLVTAEERKAHAVQAMIWLKKMALGEVPGYEFQAAEGAILSALRNDELALTAIQTAGRLPGRDAQRELATVVLDRGRKPELRAAAAAELVHHIQKNGLVLNKDKVKGIEELYARGDDAKLRPALGLVIGSLRPNPGQTGSRLKNFAPPRPAAAEPAKEK